MMDTAVLDRLQGVAVGSAVGDALGMPLEFRPIVPLDKFVRTMQAGRLPAGSFTDDTELALAVADALLVKRPLDGDVLVRQFLDWYRAGPEDVGNHTRGVLDAIKRGLTWEKATAEVLRFRPDSSGNGSIMRCWPVAVACWNDRPQLIADSTLQSRVTHPHLDCLSGSVFVNLWIAGLVQGQPIPEALQFALDNAGLSATLVANLKKAPGRRRDELENSGWVRRTLETAVWALSTTHSFSDAVIQAANLGNDADTSACVTGAIAGAAYGIGSVPPTWRQQLHGEWPLRSGKTWREAEFIALVNKLVGI
jgi:ADP-ribosyl-[dinitrogen reductase] hydrolase